ncbi:hypothetical protein [Methylocucumis oryzae]|uniref:DAC domain-containing protein n=1 Tax=Methylocucumis oryzae TaxID=1632867 RepID=A0A0F3II69_9GAMM|nr:hypothetical protein [Methylocucumis oryzae]KJV06362.1 hypothetical protein VZ94_11780 [Methylocucumis oryzae]
MTPSVFICNSISELIQRAGVGEYVPLSKEVPLESAGPALLKAAAPLCRDNWRIYIERLDDNKNCRYGVFCGSSDPSSLTVDEVILENDGFSINFPVIKIAQSSTNKVEVRTNAGSVIEFRFNDDIDVHELNSQTQIQGLASTITADIDEDRVMFSSFVERLLSSAIKNSHGTLIAVVLSSSDTLPQTLQDFVQLNPKVNLYERFRLHLDEGKTAISVSRLQAAVELISGFICSDGITIFNSAGCVLGYRAFIRSNVDNPSSEGGARSRAFTAMKQLIGTELDAAFFKSQDGQIKFYRNRLEDKTQ